MLNKNEMFENDRNILTDKEESEKIVFLKNDLNEMESIKGQQTDKYTIQEIFFVEFFRF